MNDDKKIVVSGTRPSRDDSNLVIQKSNKFESKTGLPSNLMNSNVFDEHFDGIQVGFENTRHPKPSNTAIAKVNAVNYIKNHDNRDEFDPNNPSTPKTKKPIILQVESVKIESNPFNPFAP